MFTNDTPTGWCESLTFTDVLICFIAEEGTGAAADGEEQEEDEPEDDLQIAWEALDVSP